MASQQFERSVSLEGQQGHLRMTGGGHEQVGVRPVVITHQGGGHGEGRTIQIQRDGTKQQYGLAINKQAYPMQYGQATFSVNKEVHPLTQYDQRITVHNSRSFEGPVEHQIRVNKEVIQGAREHQMTINKYVAEIPRNNVNVHGNAVETGHNFSVSKAVTEAPAQHVMTVKQHVVEMPYLETRAQRIEQEHVVHTKIIEVPKRVIKERIVEVPEIEYVERIVEVPQVVVEERVKQVARIQYENRVIQVPKTVVVEKVVEVPEIEYRNVPVEKIVEVPEIREEVVVKEVEVPQMVEVPVPEYQTVRVDEEIKRRIPVAVEVIATYEYKMPRVVPKYKEQPVPIYVPRFIEVPVASQMMDEAAINGSQELYNRLTGLSQRGSISLSEFQQLAQDSQVQANKHPKLYRKPSYGQAQTTSLQTSQQTGHHQVGQYQQTANYQQTGQYTTPGTTLTIQNAGGQTNPHNAITIQGRPGGEGIRVSAGQPQYAAA